MIRAYNTVGLNGGSVFPFFFFDVYVPERHKDQTAETSGRNVLFYSQRFPPAVWVSLDTNTLGQFSISCSGVNYRECLSPTFALYVTACEMHLCVNGSKLPSFKAELLFKERV